jgi:hypothetical protein
MQTSPPTAGKATIECDEPRFAIVCMVGLILAVAGKEHVYRDLFGTPRGKQMLRARSEGLRGQKEKKKLNGRWG